MQFEAWLHAEVPRVDCSACGKTTLVEVPWAKAAAQLWVTAKRLWRRIDHYVTAARAREWMAGVSLVGVDETSAERGQVYVTVVHDLDAKRLLFRTPGRASETVAAFRSDLLAHGGNPAEIKHVCMDMSAAYTKGVTEVLPQAQISYDRFHVIALGNEAMYAVRREEMERQPRVVKAALGIERKAVRGLVRGMRKDPSDWNKNQRDIMYQLQRSNLQSARAWRLKQALRTVYADAVRHNDAAQAESALLGWISCARRCRLEPFKRLAQTILDRLPGVLRGMLDGRSNAYVKAMNGMLQQAKTAARGFRTMKNFIAIAYLRMSRLKHLPTSPMLPATSRQIRATQYLSGRQVPYKTA